MKLFIKRYIKFLFSYFIFIYTFYGCIYYLLFLICCTFKRYVSYNTRLDLIFVYVYSNSKTQLFEFLFFYFLAAAKLVTFSETSN